MPLLEVKVFSVRHGGVTAVDGVDIEVREGEAVVLLGANGAGKSSLLRGLFGLCSATGERLTFGGRNLSGLDCAARIYLGMSMVPEGRALFPSMSVEDNLRLGQLAASGERRFEEDWDRVTGLFPPLLEKRHQRASTLSGGQQQMLAVGRALMQRPRLLCLDEPSLGLAPIVLDDLYAALGELQKQGVALLLVEQQARRALAFASRGYVLHLGRIERQGTAADLMTDEVLTEAYLGKTKEETDKIHIGRTDHER